MLGHRSWCLLVVGVLTGFAFADDPNQSIATVNSHTIQQRDVDLELLISGNLSPTPSDREAALKRVIDRRLIMQSLKINPRGKDPLTDDIEGLVNYIHQGIESGGDTVEVVLGKLKLTEDDIRRAATDSVHWQSYVRRTVTDQQLRAYFDSHRAEFDGTRVRVRQIVRIAPPGNESSERKAAIELLTNLRQQLVAETLEFSDAARTHSQSPSGQQGGEVGLIQFRGDLPPEVAAAALKLKIDEFSQPIESAFGVHLIQVTERLPGELSLEDVRPAILREIEVVMWAEKATTLRRNAKIKYLTQ